MKIAYAVLGLVVFFSLPGFSWGDDDQIGRFVLFQGHHEILIVKSDGTLDSGEDRGIFKIDTVTGQVWKYKEWMRGPTSQSEEIAIRRSWDLIDGSSKTFDARPR